MEAQLSLLVKIEEKRSEKKSSLKWKNEDVSDLHRCPHWVNFPRGRSRIRPPFFAQLPRGCCLHRSVQVLRTCLQQKKKKHSLKAHNFMVIINKPLKAKRLFTEELKHSSNVNIQCSFSVSGSLMGLPVDSVSFLKRLCSCLITHRALCDKSHYLCGPQGGIPAA